jgi:beta-lactamase class C
MEKEMPARRMNPAARACGIWALVVLAVCCAAVPTRAQEGADIRKTVDDAAGSLMAAHDVPGMAIAVTAGGRSRIFTYGVATRETGAPVTEGTLFEIGSVSKTFTATLASLAEVQGKMSLGDHPGRYVPELRGAPVDKASLLHLGTYTAGGLPLQFPDTVRTDKETKVYLRTWKPDAAPGAQRRYSNPSIGLLGHVTGVALGSDYATAVEADLFPRLGMSQSYVRVPKSAMGSYAQGYTKDDKPIRITGGMFGAEAYGVRSTAGDMIRFVEANITPEVLDGEIRRAVENTHIGFFRTAEMTQGLGWEQYPYPVSLESLLAGNSSQMIWEPNPATEIVPPRKPEGPTLFNKTGSTNGFSAYVAFVPDKKIGLVMLANKNFPIPARIKAAHRILEQLARDGD